MKWCHPVTHKVHGTKGKWNVWDNNGDAAQNKYKIHVNTNHHCPRKTVTFVDPLPVYKRHTFSTSLQLCNRHIDWYPREVFSPVDLAAIDHFMTALYTRTDPQPTARGMIVGCTNRSYMQATAIDTLDLLQLLAKARGCHKFKDINLPLISVPKLCRARCKVNFHQNTVTITDNLSTELIMGEWDPTHNLYMIKVPAKPQLKQSQPHNQLQRAPILYAPPRTSSITSTPQQGFSPWSHLPVPLIEAHTTPGRASP